MPRTRSEGVAERSAHPCGGEERGYVIVSRAAEMGNSTSLRRVVMPSYDGHAVYPMRLPIRYELVNRPGVRGGGTTVRIGSHVVFFISDQHRGIHEKLRLTLEWPASLPDGTSINLWIFGTVVQEDSLLVEVAITRYEFRTRKKSASEIAPASRGESIASRAVGVGIGRIREADVVSLRTLRSRASPNMPARGASAE